MYPLVATLVEQRGEFREFCVRNAHRPTLLA
jgi:hypothetical protein